MSSKQALGPSLVGVSDENTPLLRNAGTVQTDISPDVVVLPIELTEAQVAHEPNAVIERFSERTRRVILALVSFGGLTQLFVAGSFITSIPSVSREFSSTPAIINLAVSASILTAAFGMLVFSTYSGWYGRRPIFLIMLPILCGGSLGVAASRSVAELLTWRIVQAFGASGGFSVGAGVIGDVYPLEERGKAMGVFFGFAFLGPAIAPFVGGAVAHYASWRIMQLSIAIASAAAFILFYYYFPETTRPSALQSAKPQGDDAVPLSDQPKLKWVWLNPFKDLLILRSPNVLAVTICAMGILLSEHILLNPLAYTIGKRYNLENESLIGLCFLPSGIGNVVGAPLAGRMSDLIIVKYRARRETWMPEDRLRASVPGVLLIVPISLLAVGLTVHFIEGPLGLALSLCFLFINGVGVDYALTPMSAYMVDILHSRSAQVTAATACLRSLFIGAATSAFIPIIVRIGVLAANAITAGFVWFSLGLLLLTITYGVRMRAWIDVGYSSTANN